MRYSKKDIAYTAGADGVFEIPDIVEGRRYTGQAIIKLGQLEDIEEELGVNLITLLRGLLDSGIVWVKLPYVPENNGALPEIIVVDIAVETKWSFKKPCYFKLEIGTCQFNFYLKDYGKTWALTKEELR